MAGYKQGVKYAVEWGSMEFVWVFNCARLHWSPKMGIILDIG